MQLNPWKTITFGILLWLVPFVVSLFFFSSNGELAIDQLTFRTIMLLTLAFTLTGLTWFYFKSITTDFVKSALQLGLIWLVVNWVLDLLVLVAVFGNPLDEWLVATGARYVMIPIVTTLVGLVVSDKVRWAKKLRKNTEVASGNDESGEQDDQTLASAK